ncbi:unnamed protein product [Rhizoctonia solani]|uniref:Uncharacterized protein n=1 Tax=Rhizoctonia solani TaxID=456999 RepID=A0A8H3DDE1_9AGAM|nr:unnamed protein product [Rhizoctonia solani]
MESMFGKFPLANRPKMTRRKRKNLSLAPGASSAASTTRTRKGGNSPTTEPTSGSVDTAPGPSSSTAQSPTASLSGSGPQRRSKGIHQGRKRGGNHYNWLPTNDHPSSPTTDETLPITPRSDMSSTFSVSPSPRPSFQQPQSPVYERRNAVSAGPLGTQFGFLPGTGADTFAPTSAPLIPAHTWPGSAVEGSQRFPESASGGLIHTRSDGALGPRSQMTLNQRTGAEYGQPTFEAPQAAVSYDPDQRPYYDMTNYQPSHSFDRSSGIRTDSPLLAGQTFPWRDYQLPYSSGTTAGHRPNALNDNFNFSSPSVITGFPDMTPTAYESYLSANEGIQEPFFDLPNAYAPLVADLGTGIYLQGISSDTRRVSAQDPQDPTSLANLAFSRTPSTQ